MERKEKGGDKINGVKKKRRMGKKGLKEERRREEWSKEKGMIKREKEEMKE